MSKFVFACLEHSLSTQLPEMGCAMLETLSELPLGPTFSTGESVPVKSVQKGALTSGTLSFNLFPYSKENILVHLTSHSRDSPFQDEMRGSYVLSMTAQYGVGLTLCGVDCPGQESEQFGKPGLVLKLSICSSSVRETGTQAIE